MNAYRRRGLVLVVGGVALGGALFVALIALSRMGVIQPTAVEHTIGRVTVQESRYSAIWGLPAVVPLFTTLLGAIQLLLGRSFSELGTAYQTMSGGRRFVVSVLIVGLALAVILGLVAIAFAIML